MKSKNIGVQIKIPDGMSRQISTLRENVFGLFRAGIEQVNVYNLFNQRIKVDNGLLTLTDISNKIYAYKLSEYKNIYLVGAGKVSSQMAEAIKQYLPSQILSGVVITKYGFGVKVAGINIMEASHPLPDENGVSGAIQISGILQNACEDDLVVCLLSGGGSALLTLPIEGISLRDKITITETLLKNGSDIEELNIVRKALSVLKGGGLARLAAPAKVVSVILSDVVSDNTDIIASGPTSESVVDLNLFTSIMIKYRIDPRLVDKAIKSIEKRLTVNRTSEAGNADNIIIGNNDMALRAIKLHAGKMGYKTILIKEKITGDVKRASAEYIKQIKALLKVYESEKKLCVVSGGETTVNVIGNGLGGRNLEFALNIIEDLDEFPNSVLLSAGSDGDDGNSGSAGAIIDNTTYLRSKKLQLNVREYLGNNDSYTFLKHTNDILPAYKTNTNVMDIQIFLVEK